MRLVWFTSAGPARGWQHPDSAAHDRRSLDSWAETVGLLERRGALDALVLADIPALPSAHGGTHAPYVRAGVGGIWNDPLPLLAGLAARTSRIGLVATVSTTLTRPESLARQFATLDTLSAGRSGWNVVTSYGAGPAANHGLEVLPPSTDRYDLADEYLAGVQRSWDRDALPQGRPVIVQAGASPRGRRFAAEHAEVIVIHRDSPSGMREFRDDLRVRARAAGRDPDSLSILFTATLCLAPTRAEAVRRRQDEHRAALDSPVGIALHSHRLGRDLSGLALDEPIPAHVLAGLERRSSRISSSGPDGPTLRELGAAELTGGTFDLVGTPQDVAAQMAETMAEVGGDGFAILEPVLPSLVLPFVDGVVPALRQRGLVTDGYPAATFRQNLLARQLEVLA